MAASAFLLQRKFVCADGLDLATEKARYRYHRHQMDLVEKKYGRDHANFSRYMEHICMNNLMQSVVLKEFRGGRVPAPLVRKYGPVHKWGPQTCKEVRKYVRSIGRSPQKPSDGQLRFG